jgi:tRNA G37 N-methylase TrmD
MSNNMIEIHIISLFPESVRPYLDTSIMQRAQDKGLFRYILHNLADYSVKNTRRVDDRPYGWGAGTLITVEPLAICLRDIHEETHSHSDSHRNYQKNQTNISSSAVTTRALMRGYSTCLISERSLSGTMYSRAENSLHSSSSIVLSGSSHEHSQSSL